MTWELAVQLVLGVLGVAGVIIGAVLVDRRVQRARRVDWEQGSAQRAQAIDGETITRLRDEVGRLSQRVTAVEQESRDKDSRIDDLELEHEAKDRRIDGLSERITVLERVLRTHDIPIPPNGEQS